MHKENRQTPACQELINEGWLFRIVLELLKTRPEVDTLIKVVDRCLEDKKTK